jgi:uncharacterized protein YhjY with autotransporter beta-barrel domain
MNHKEILSQVTASIPFCPRFKCARAMIIAAAASISISSSEVLAQNVTIDFDAFGPTSSFGGGSEDGVLIGGIFGPVAVNSDYLGPFSGPNSIHHDAAGSAGFNLSRADAGGFNLVSFRAGSAFGGAEALTVSGYLQGGLVGTDVFDPNPPDSYVLYTPTNLAGVAMDELRFDMGSAGPGPTHIDDIILAFIALSDASGSSLIASMPGFGIQTVRPFLHTTNTHLRQQAIRGPRGSVVRQEVSMAGMLEQVKSYSSDWEAWFQGYGEDGDVGTGPSSYNYGLYGGAVGADRWINNDTLLGIFAGSSSASMDLDIGGAGVDVDSARMGVQALKRWKKAYLLGSLYYGSSQYDGTRATATGTASSDFDGDEFGTYIEMGFPIAISDPGYPLDGVTIQPLVAFQYTQVNQDGYTETGAGASNLVVGAQNESSERLSLGVLMTKNFKTPAGTLRPYVEGRYTHEFNGGSQVVNANFSGGGAVVSQGAETGEDFLEARIGASLDLSERTSLYGGLEGRYSSETSVNGAFAGVRVRF